MEKISKNDKKEFDYTEWMWVDGCDVWKNVNTGEYLEASEYDAMLRHKINQLKAEFEAKRERKMNMKKVTKEELFKLLVRAYEAGKGYFCEELDEDIENALKRSDALDPAKRYVMEVSVGRRTKEGKCLGNETQHIITLSNEKAVQRFLDAVIGGQSWESVIEMEDCLEWNEELDM